ncbi:MAG: type I DNA topoisomerase [Cyanobacteriota bacterium]
MFLRCREITKKAILSAIQNPRKIDDDLVNAQQARRVLDRIVGYELSPVLWKKIKTGLSAGRVQSVALRIVVEREREIEKFNSKSVYKVIGIFDTGKGKSVKAELSEKFDTHAKAKEFLEKCLKSDFKVSNLEKKPVKKSPSPPFTTSTLQQEASLKLGYSVSQTMMLAQKLYESGKISYMRTDSLNLSEDAIEKAKNEIEKSFGKNFLEIRKYKTKSENAQEAHEAIRPTDFSVQTISGERNEQRLYELIWKRAIASQMSDAKLERTIVTIDISAAKQKFIASGEVILFEGFLKVYIASNSEDEEDDESKDLLPPMEIGQMLKNIQINARETFSRPSARYTEASLVKKLEEMGIGRPSTYAPTISTIQKRDYVIKESREGKEREYKELILKSGKIEEKSNKETFGNEKNKLFPTNMGMIVNDFLVEHFDDIVDYSFTVNVEKEFDEISCGKKKWNKMIKDFYGDFHTKVEKATGIDRATIQVIREIGIDPKTDKKIYARMGKFGALVQIGEATETEKPQYASMRKGQFIETITLEDALELFKLPRESGIFEDLAMTVALGRFGPYIRHDSKFYSLTKEDDPMTVSTDRCIEIIVSKRKADAEKTIKTFPDNAEVKVLNGRFGPYIKFEDKNVKIPKGKDPKELTYDECFELASHVEAKPSKKKFAKKTEPIVKAKAGAKKETSKVSKTTKKTTTVKKKATAKTKVEEVKPAKETKKVTKKAEVKEPKVSKSKKEPK